MPFVNVGELRTHYNLIGADMPILMFSNSLGTDFTMWDAQMPELSNHFGILRYDTRGHGKTSVTPGDYTIEQLGRDVVGLLDALKIERVHVCGLSMGGMIGIWLGIHAPERLNRLVLANTAPRTGTIQTWNSRIFTVRKEGMKPVAAAVTERWFTPEFRESFPEKVAIAQQMLEMTSPDGYAACCAAIRDMDQRDGIAKIKTTTLLIYGGKDPVTPPSDAQSMKEQIAGSETMEL